MENETSSNATKLGSDGVKPTTAAASSDLEQNPNSNSSPSPPPPPPPADSHNESAGSDSTSRHSSRTPFSNLSQVDADLALARTLQEQERAYAMLTMRSVGSDFGRWAARTYALDGEYDDDTESDGDDDEDDDEDGTDVNDDDDAFDVLAHEVDGEHNNPDFELDPGNFSSDEAYARALQDAEDREMTAGLFAHAGLEDQENDDLDDQDDQDENSQGSWEDVDPDELSYEELLALGEMVGTESRGLSADTIASLPSINFKTGSNQTGSNDLCVICRLDFEDDETLTVLSCKHSYHSECLNNWLKIKRVCPVCSAEVSTSTATGSR